MYSVGLHSFIASCWILHTTSPIKQTLCIGKLSCHRPVQLACLSSLLSLSSRRWFHTLWKRQKWVFWSDSSTSGVDKECWMEWNFFSVSWPKRTSGAFLVCNQWLHPLSSPTRINLLFLSKRLVNSTWVTCQLWELWHQTILLLSKAFVTLLKWQIKSSSVSLLQQAGSLWLHSLVYYTQIDEVLLLHPSLLFVLNLLILVCHSSHT